MTHGVAFCAAGCRFPLRTRAVAAAASIETKSGNCHENMAIPYIKGDPITFAFFAISEIVF